MSIWPHVWTVEELGLKFPDNGDTLQRWQESLDDLEQQAQAALKVAAGETATRGEGGSGTLNWAAPEDLGPLPEVLVDRARSVVELQAQAATVIAESRDDVEREMAQLTRPNGQVQPVYVDVTG